MAKKGPSGQIALAQAAAGEQVSPMLRLSLAWMKKSKVFELPTLRASVADTHAHLMSFWKVDPVSALARAAAAGVAQGVLAADGSFAGKKPFAPANEGNERGGHER